MLGAPQSGKEAKEYIRVCNILKKQGVKITYEKYKHLKDTGMLIIVYPYEKTEGEKRMEFFNRLYPPEDEKKK